MLDMEHFKDEDNYIKADFSVGPCNRITDTDDHYSACCEDGQTTLVFEFAITGMTCAACSSAVEKGLTLEF